MAIRRDAAQNRKNLLLAARDLVAANGEMVPLEEIAAAAKVSRTTLFRHFPTRDDLVAALYDENLELIDARSKELAGSPGAVRALFDFVLDLQMEQRGVAPLLPRGENGRFDEQAARTANAFSRLLSVENQETGLKTGIEVLDLLLAIQMAEAATSSETQTERIELSGRYRKILVSGLFLE